jgi:HlyD family secretion protein
MDAITLESQLAEANASVSAAQEKLTVAQAAIVRTQSEIELAQIEAERAKKLLAENAGSQREYDVRRMMVQTTEASLAENEAQLATAKKEVEVARANVATVQSRIDDATLESPVLGRVLYRLAEPGEVLGPGGKALTLVNLEDVYMEIFVPAEVASKVKLGAEARIRGDYDMGRVAPAYVSFVSPEAQFTPKQVETKSEREKLMFRVKLQVPKEIVGHYIAQVKTGVRGVGYVKLDPSVAWPSWLSQLIPTVPVTATGDSTATADTTSAAGAK